MHPVRIIPRLDIKAPHVIKGIQLEGLRVIGDPSKMANHYYQEGADELILMDTVASLFGRNTILPLIQQVAQDVFVPLTVGGGIRTCEDIANVLRSGADKVAINSAATAQPSFLREASSRFGSQAIVLSIEAKRSGDHWEVMRDNGREPTGRDLLEWIHEAESLGVGEILVTSVDQDGTGQGMDLGLIETVLKHSHVPVIPCGGIGELSHIDDLLNHPVVETPETIGAIATGYSLHYEKLTIEQIKQKLQSRGISVRHAANN